ncbi:MAG TPA: protein kinase [Solirubrobacterales bacterium]|nr:protein kinase [Solirubrobacterales bacterium]
MSIEGTIRGSGAASLPPGSPFGGYRVERVLGHGGMGIVYLARQLELERPVALKVIRPELAHDRHFRARFRSESRTAASIHHPRVVTVFAAGELDGLLYVAMRYVPGEDLGRSIAARGLIRPERAAELIAQVGDGLDAVHAAGLVHRDVKPANVIVEDPGRDGRAGAFLTDFGLAKAAAATDGLTATGEVIGSVDYMAPEQIESGPIDARTDVYALGCVLFHALSGRVPYAERESSAKMWAHLNEPPPAAGSTTAGVPRGLDAVIRRAMAKDPAERFPSAGDLGRAALAAVRGEALTEPERAVGSGEAAATETQPIRTEVAPAPTVPLATPPRKRRRRRRRRLLAGLVALILIGALAVAAIVAVPRLTDEGGGSPKPAGITIPDLSGQPLDAAEQRLRGLGLEPSAVSDSLFGVLFPSDWDVCRSEPAAGEAVKPRSTVRLVVDRPDVC